MDLSVIIPSYNSEGWIGDTLAHLAHAHSLSGFERLEVLLVDDGSTDQSVEEGREAALRLGIRLVVHSQPNMGRHKARLAGFVHARYSHVLLLDTRVFLDSESLAFVSGKFLDTPQTVWTAHVQAATNENPIAGFWQAIEHIAWRRYFRQPREVCFGSDDFDFFPKGTTALIGERRVLREAFMSFKPRVSDWRKANDDTAVLRGLAGNVGINISPKYSCTYNARTTLREFLRHAHHRGAVLVDGYWTVGTRFRHGISAFMVSSVMFPIVAVVGATSVPATPVVVGAPMLLAILLCGLLVSARALGATWHDSFVLARYSPLFAVCYGAGIWRGAWLRFRTRLSRSA